MEDFQSCFTGVIMFLLHIHWKNTCRIPRYFFLNDYIYIYNERVSGICLAAKKSTLEV